MRYTHEQLVQHYNKQAAKRVGGMVLLFSPDGQLLITKPAYKTGWSLVGGTVDEGESPLVAASREVGEEVGLALSVERFVFYGMRYAHPQKTLKDFIQIFFAVHLSADEVKLIKPHEREISEYKFVSIDQLKQYADHPRMQAVVALLADTAPSYMENEKVISSALDSAS